MRAAVWTAPLAAELRDVAPTEPRSGHAVLRVLATGICGSDLHGYRGHSAARIPPLILGHEAVLVDGGGVEYVVNPLIGCGGCDTCRRGAPNLCAKRGLLGLDRSGTFAEYVSVPRDRLIALDGRMSPLLGTLVEPLATAMQALRSSALGKGAVVSIIGAGPIGLLAAYAARAAGAALVTCQDIDPRRVAHAVAMTDAVGLSVADVLPEVLAASDGRGADLVIDAVGIRATWAAALELVRRGGTIAAIGLAAEHADVPIAAIVRDAITVRGVYAYEDEDFRAAFDLLTASPPALDWVVTAPLEEAPRLLGELARGQGLIKVVLEP